MAKNLKDIKISGAALKGKEEWPTKTDINLAIDPSTKSSNSPMTIILFVIVIILIVIFAKFGVIDVMSNAVAANAKITDVQHQSSVMTEAMSDYSDVQKQYETIAANAYTDEEAAYVDRSAVLDLLETDFPNKDKLKSATLVGNNMALVFNDTSLNAASSIVAALEENSNVQSVSVSSAQSTATENTVTTTVTVTFVAKGTGK